MTARELAEYNVGENLDQLMNLDPRGYGVCRILYPASRRYAGGPTAMAMAKKIVLLLTDAPPDTVVCIMTGFILRPHLQPETDGIVGALLLARALVRGFGITPVFVIPEKNVPAVTACAPLLGLHLYDSVQQARQYPLSCSYVTIPVDQSAAREKTAEVRTQIHPAFLFSTETAGANAQGEYHNAVGINMTGIEAKQDELFSAWQADGVPSFAVGDLGNEMGMGTLAEHIEKYIPYAGSGTAGSGCTCGCQSGILAATKADYVVTATVSDWGVYAVIAALAFLKKNIDILHDEAMEALILTECSRSGMVDMTGALIPSIDGFDVEMEKQIVGLMRNTVAYALAYSSPRWFETVLEKGFYEQPV
jgi:hypothetical protein